MTDLEMTMLCAKAMKIVCTVSYDRYSNMAFAEIIDPANPGNGGAYGPLHDDAQCMALEDYLIERGYLHYEDGEHMFYTWPLETSKFIFSADFKDKAGRRRAIVACVAQMEAAKLDADERKKNDAPR